MGGSELNPLLGRMDDEDCFGFHSEYYVDLKWRKRGMSINSWGWDKWAYTAKGYARYSKYRDDIYLIAKYDKSEKAVYIVKSNVAQKTSTAIKLVAKSSFGYDDYDAKTHLYIAVNRRGYFIYDTKMITLFGFDGREICTHKFAKPGKSDYAECVYIYDNTVIYSETRQAPVSTKIYCVNMVTRENWMLWGTQKDDSDFDDYLRENYRQRWSRELPVSKPLSNISDVGCQFLYANKRCVVAGYARQGKSGKDPISYIIHIDLVENKWSILDCFAGPDLFLFKVPSWKRQEIENYLPSWNAGHIFSFNMLDDTMWVKMSGKDIRLVHTDIQRVVQLTGKYPVDRNLGVPEGTKSYYFFDGKSAYLRSQQRLDCIRQNGETERIVFHHTANLDFFCLDGIWPAPWKGCTFLDITNLTKNHPATSVTLEIDRFEYGIRREELDELIQNAKQPELAAERKADAPVSSADDDGERAIQEMARKAVDDALAADTSGYHYSEADIEELMRVACKTIRQMRGTAPEDEVLSHKENGRGVTNGPQLSLAAFRANAPSMTGFREALLSYRKSLPNNWDYNAFVGILLGVRGPKHGDAACMNFAIGQGDNGNNTKKTIETKGLMPLFEKYKGKKIDETILLSDVEDEILAIAPEYAPIRRRLHEIMEG